MIFAHNSIKPNLFYLMCSMFHSTFKIFKPNKNKINLLCSSRWTKKIFRTRKIFDFSSYKITYEKTSRTNKALILSHRSTRFSFNFKTKEIKLIYPDLTTSLLKNLPRTYPSLSTSKESTSFSSFSVDCVETSFNLLAFILTGISLIKFSSLIILYCPFYRGKDSPSLKYLLALPILCSPKNIQSKINKSSNSFEAAIKLVPLYGE